MNRWKELQRRKPKTNQPTQQTSTLKRDCGPGFKIASENMQKKKLCNLLLPCLPCEETTLWSRRLFLYCGYLQQIHCALFLSDTKGKNVHDKQNQYVIYSKTQFLWSSGVNHRLIIKTKSSSKNNYTARAVQQNKIISLVLELQRSDVQSC